MVFLKMSAWVAMTLVVLVSPSLVNAQVVYSYQLVPQTVYEKQPVTVSRWVDETVMEKQKVTSYKPVWETSTRERTNVSYKPVQTTSEREQRIVTYKPIVETHFHENRIEETTYEMVTEYRTEQYVVRKPVVETQMRSETYTVRKPVTENLIEVNRTTSYKPVVRQQTQMVPMATPVDMMVAVPDNASRPRLQRLTPGYYTDPATGMTVYRNRGLHWVQPTVAVPTVGYAPTLVPQQVDQIEYIPETVESRKPVEVTRYVDTVETRKVPVEVTRYVESVETRQVPYTVRKPITRVRTERIPYTKRTYKEEVTTKKVPYTETTYQRVETVEPYEVKELNWIPETREVDVPRTIRKRVDYQIMRDVPRTIMMKVPVDICGNPLGAPVPVAGQVTIQPLATTTTRRPTVTGGLSMGSGTTLTRRVAPNFSPIDNPAGQTPLRYQGQMEVVTPMTKPLDETSGRSKSVLVNDDDAETNLQKLRRPEGEKTLKETSGREAATEANVPSVEMPEDEPSETGDEKAADRTPVLSPPL